MNKLYKVTINFRKGPSYTISNIPCGSTHGAQIKAVLEARNDGFNEKVKNISAVEM